MHVALEDFKTGWLKVNVALRESEIDVLVDLLKSLKQGENDRFHLASDFEGDKGVGDIEFYLKSEDQPDNMGISGPPISPTR
jgi:hypothetical protein